MKKLILLTIILFCMTAAAAAEPLDLNSMSLEELIDLRRDVNAEINSRMQGTDAVFQPFEYKVDTHIPAGMYIVTCVEILNGKSAGCIAAWAEGKSSWSCHTVEYVQKPGDIVLIELAPGDTFSIDDCSVVLTPYTLPSI